MNWYYCRDGETIEGPLEETALLTMAAKGELPATTLVAAVGADEWRPLSSICPGPPALPSSATPPPVPAASAPPTNGKSWFARLSMPRKAAVVVCGGFVALILLGLAGGGGNQAPASQAASPQSAPGSPVNEEAIFRQLDAMTPKRQYACPECTGTGQIANTRPRHHLEGQNDVYGNSNACETCSGNGTIRTQSGFDTTCPICSGLGNKKSRPCAKCGGSGQLWGY